MTPDIAAIRERVALWVKNGCPQPEHQYDMAPNDRAALLALLDEAVAALRDALNPLTYRLPEEANAAIGAIETVLAKLEGK